MSELTLEILDEAMSKLPPISYPKRMSVSCADYQKLREALPVFGLDGLLSTDKVFGIGMDIVPDMELSEYEYEFDY